MRQSFVTQAGAYLGGVQRGQLPPPRPRPQNLKEGKKERKGKSLKKKEKRGNKQSVFKVFTYSKVTEKGLKGF